MNSEELNRRISEICDESEIYGFQAFGGKTIPYIGWYWRTVDFDRTDGYAFGVMPPHAGSAFESACTEPHVGFMENNKWDYDYVHANAEQWAEIKRLLIAAVTEPSVATLKAANDAIQALAR